MRHAFFAALLLSISFVAIFPVTLARAQDSSAAVSEALDKVVNLDVNGIMPQVMKKITDQTAVPIEIPPRVYDLLPWGEQTNIKATVKNQTVRQALTAITRKLGLNWELGPQGVKLVPRIPLERIGRRATIQELETLDYLDTTPLGATPAPGKPTTVEWVINAIDKKLAENKSPIAVEFRVHDKTQPDQSISLQRNATLNDALKELTKQTDFTWYAWGPNVVVLSKEDQIARQLDRTITRNFNGADIAQVLAELSQASGVEFNLEPGALQRVPADFRRITLILGNAKIREALENIRGVTGLDYIIKPGGVYLWNQNAPAPAATTPSPIVATLQLDNGLSVFLRANDLPPDILEYVEHKKTAEYKRLRQQMKDDKFVPTTQPSATP
ncbi:MAG TPA: DUF4974 domain-containing protein [Tepidisphaeraceae bacterium]|jgi:hypothetical protein|nr:DUF4974 domain-containing protein [Tepidisphaeraceae bacterium]